jgi:hypothetical protein
MATPTLSATGPSSSVIGSITSFNWTAGRQAKSDPFKSGTGSITIRNPQDLPAAIVLEALVTVSINGFQICGGYVTNISYNYGMVPNEDTATISLEGYLAFLGRGYTKNLLMPGGTTGEYAVRIGNNLTGGARTIINNQTRSICAGPQFYDGNSQDLLLTLVTTESGRLNEAPVELTFLGRDVLIDPTSAPYSLSNVQFTDTNPATTGMAYDNLEFASLTDNYFTQVTVAPQSFAGQVFQAGTGPRNLQLNTDDETAEQALSLAQYSQAQFSSAVSVPVTISTKNSLNNALDPAQLISIGCVSARLPIVFRGATFNTIIEGWNVSANPDDVRYTFNVSDFRQNNVFILNDPIYGVLDTSKLGF